MKPARKVPNNAQVTGFLSLLVVQPTSFCNIDCDYCYLPDRAVKNIMSENTLETLFERVFASPYIADTGFTLVWHAGEPMVLPITFYRQAQALLDKANAAGVPVQMSFQTNGTLLTDAWCELFRDTGATVGVSIDGPQKFHDRHRKTRSGKGSFDRAMAGIRCLQRNDIPFSVISVLTADALRAPDEIYRFFVEHGITNVGFNIEEMEGANTSTSLSFDSCYGDFYDFMARFVELNTDGALRLREVNSFKSFLRIKDPRTLGDQCQPLRIVTVDWRGGLSTFSPELHGLPIAPYGPFVFANVHDHRLEDILLSPRFAAVQADILAGVEKCRLECPYYDVCGGGAPANKVFENRSFASTETIYCRTRVKAMTDVLLTHFEAECGFADQPVLVS